MSIPAYAPQAGVPASPSPRRGQLALALQEAFTVTVRLREGRQVAADAFSFRAHVKQLLATADQEARRGGYPPEYVRQAIYAFTAFLDESVLNSALPIFGDWSRQPLQEELFGDHIAGENFFRHLQQLLSAPDSEDLADLLEVHQLCLLLGFRGRYAAGEQGERMAFQREVGARIARIRGPEGDLSPSAFLPRGETVPPARDRWVPRLMVGAGALLVLLVILHVVYRVLLGGGMEPLRTLAG